MNTCVIGNQDCTKYVAKGLCVRHYQKKKRTGDPLGGRTTESHGMNGTPEYRAWRSMKQRCYDASFASYKYYGGRGISVCPEWLNSFNQFYVDMGPKPGPTYSLDRRDPDGNYEPSNCHWATAEYQAINRRVFDKNPSGHSGVLYDAGPYKRRWAARIRVKGKLILLGRFYTKDEAILARKTGEIKFWGRLAV